jgi:uncharacterized RDD family membrane protein YckC
MKEIDFYAVLGVRPDAEDVVIAAAYRSLAKRYHPDQWKGDPSVAHQRMSKINLAFEVLGNAACRSEYDKKRAQTQQPGFASEDANDQSQAFTIKTKRAKVKPQCRYSPKWRRGFATSVDLALACAIGYFGFCCTGFVIIEKCGGNRDMGIGMATVVSVSIIFGYFLFKDWLLRGKSIGKLLLGILVVRRNGNGPISCWVSVKRNAPFFMVLVATMLFTASSFLNGISPDTYGKLGAVLLGGGLLQIYRIKDKVLRTTLGDSWADTIVVNNWGWSEKLSTASPE